jgi:hypothetical protein
LASPGGLHLTLDAPQLRVFVRRGSAKALLEHNCAAQAIGTCDTRML